jgi:metal-responsive CopG/Arc/MetJ family transcriptional regulator
MEEMRLTRLSVNMNDQTAEELERLSQESGLTKTEVIRRAVAMAAWLRVEQRKGRKIVTMTDRDKDWRELVLF